MNLKTSKNPKPQVPSTRRWIRSIVGLEPTGRISVATRNFYIKLGYWSFYATVFWGMFNHVSMGIYREKHEVFLNTSYLYDKLEKRNAPFRNVWTRPG